MEKLNLYSYEKWTDRVYTITVNYSCVHRINLMVVVGDEKVLVIDSAHGVDHDLRKYIEDITGCHGMPMTLTCTHIGIDHAGGAILFDEWYVNHGDWFRIDTHLTREARDEDIDCFTLNNNEMMAYIKANLCEAPDKSKLRDIFDGHIFDLGGIEVHTISTPGHSDGHMAYYMPSEKIAFVGDAINVDVHLKALNRQQLGEYAYMLEAFEKKIDPDTMMFAAHLNRPHKMRVLRNLAAACREICEGKTQDDPPGEAIQQHTDMFRNPNMKMHYHGNCCIVYNEGKFEEKVTPSGYINFFSHEKMGERLYIFNEGYSMVHRFTIGCIVGDEKIMLIDAGMGMTSDFRKYVESVVGTDKPIIVACTHGHLDHVGSACLFDERYCSLEDFDPAKMVMPPFDAETRLSDLKAFALENDVIQEYCEKNMIRDNSCEFKDIKDGDIFDLGGVKIQAIGLPGHSPGSMAFYDAEGKYVFTGDAINTDTHLKRLNNDDFRQYKKTIERFIDIVGEDVTLYPAHLPMPMDINVAKHIAMAAEDLAENRTGGDPPGEVIFLGRQNNPDIRMHYVGNCCIIYNRTYLS